MNRRELIEKYYTKELIVKMVTSYILYYQISLSGYIFETTQDTKETLEKLKELNLAIEPGSIQNIMKDIAFECKDQNEFNEYLKLKAILHSLNDFVKNDKDLLGAEKFLKYKQNEIENGKAFNTNMKVQYLNEYPILFKQYNDAVDEEYALSVRNIIIDSI